MWTDVRHDSHLGHPGPAFLVVWLLLALATLALPRLALVAARRGPVAPPGPTLTPEQLGALAGGTDRAVSASVAGVTARDGLYHDTHAHPLTEPVLDLLADLLAGAGACGTRPAVMLERDDRFPSDADLAAELGLLRREHDRAGARR